jgi:hypothetical protein
MENFTRDDFDSADLLTALDQLDSIRYNLAGEDDIGPPQVRTDLLELHQLILHLVTYSGNNNKEKILELLEDIQVVIGEIQESADSISDSLDDLETALNKCEEE